MSLLYILQVVALLLSTMHNSLPLFITKFKIWSAKQWSQLQKDNDKKISNSASLCRIPLQHISPTLAPSIYRTFNKLNSQCLELLWCNCERMRDKDIKFIHIISIMTVVYSNGINQKILMSHWRHLITTFKLPQASYIVLLDNIRTHEWFPSSNLSQPASIRLCTLCFRVIQWSMECPGTPPW